MSSEFRIDSVSQSHVGAVRTNNEDSFCDRGAEGFWAVADGMGGHERGEWASGAIAETLARVALPDDFDLACRLVPEAIHDANARIWDEASGRGIQMGSTVVALRIGGGRFAVFWVGDSRAYLLREGMLIRLTRDHTQVQELVDRGLLSEESAVDHPMSHILARAVGVQAEVEVDVVADEVEPGDLFLLCSDGLTGQVAEDEIAAILRRNGHDEAVRKLIALTLERGAPDNVTVILAGVAEKTLLTLAQPAGTLS
jgi:serine/threonine-protein phosphatase Stp1